MELQTLNLLKATRVVLCLTTQEWPDAKELGKEDKGQGPDVVRSLKQRNGHVCPWQDPKWQCSVWGQTAKNKHGGSCKGGVSLAMVHKSHALSSAMSPDPNQPFPVIFCTRCGGTKTGSSTGLHKACRDMSTAGSAKRVKNIGEGRHPYTGKKWEVFGPLVRGADI